MCICIYNNEIKIEIKNLLIDDDDKQNGLQIFAIFNIFKEEVSQQPNLFELQR